MSPGEGKAIAAQEKEHVEEVKSQGLCVMCEDNPYNPFLSNPLCLECWNSMTPAGCCVKGCPNSPDGHLGQAQYCKTHLADNVHKAYSEYLKMRSKWGEQKALVEKLIHRIGYDPTGEGSKPHRKQTDEERGVVEEFHKARNIERDMLRLKGDIKHALEENSNLFPEDYEVFG